MSNICIIIPLCPQVYNYIQILLEKIEIINKVCDIIIVFSNIEEYEEFAYKDKIKKVIIPDNTVTGNIVTFKKFYALKLLKNLYSYYIVCDSEIDIINENFTKSNINNKINMIFKNKYIYTGVLKVYSKITKYSCKIFNNQNYIKKLKKITSNYRYYYWWSDLPVYKGEHLEHFFSIINFDNINFYHFDHKIYLNYLLLFHKFQFINLTKIINLRWSLESFRVQNGFNNLQIVSIEHLKILKKNYYTFSWVCPELLIKHELFLIQNGSFLIYHIDRHLTNYNLYFIENKLKYNNHIKIYKELDIKCNDLYSKTFKDINQFIIYFENSQSSMVSFDLINMIGYFKINDENIGDINNLEDSEKKYYKNNQNFITLKKKYIYKENIILIPTYINHFNYCIKLLKSNKKNILDLKKINIFIILSSINELKEFIKILNFPININLLIYNVTYSNKNKYNYQCFKKFFGLLKINYKYAYLLDSDFEFINNIYIIDDIQKYKNKIYMNKSDFYLDKMVLSNINKIIQTNFSIFPLELPWIFEKEKILEINNNINLKSLFNYKGVIFEIILYRLYLLKKYYNELDITKIPINGFIFDFNYEYISLFNHKYAIAFYNKETIFQETKLIIHNDR